MVLESTMICVDDSDFMRNGDFAPTRMAAMQDAVNIVCLSKTRSNPENNVGLLTMASSEVLTTLTTDVNKLMSKLLAVQPQGEVKLMSGLRVAHLALKHRQGKNHKMRIVLFVGSPVDAVDAAELTRLAKRLKKEKVNVDVVSFGEERGNENVLKIFIDTLNGKDGTASHLVIVPPGPNLTDALVASPIMQSEDGAPIPGIGGGGYDFGIDPNDDPELALALRVSMEEQRARQEAEAKANNPAAVSEEAATTEDQMLEQALAMSMGTGGASSSRGAGTRVEPDFNNMTEEEQIAYAMQMSMADSGVAAGAKSEAVKTEEPMDVDDAASGQDPEFLKQVLEAMDPGTPGDKSDDKKPDPKGETKKK
ncbi:26S proteasome non-ATPase regulatory subunit 4 [Orchesella cincta]|uniref:26S proteasome non-ATPase regulatory subunit 4 n=1 Tax=Orchesella cincta TaxID=48709 RepID=A0A1D2MV83_ORCCI|nr:26S proteasome non-ATPase regulatory subunit 4 [Orchesella cincta]